MSEAVAMESVTRRFETGGLRIDAVREVDLSVHEGELVAVLGRSGSGKTTLLSLVGGLDRPDAGQVSVGGQVLGALDEAGLDEFRRRTVGWVFQTSGLLPLLMKRIDPRLLVGVGLLVFAGSCFMNLHLDQNYEWIVIGCAIVIAVVIDQWSTRLTARRLAHAAALTRVST